jgi:hypothetical protein
MMEMNENGITHDEYEFIRAEPMAYVLNRKISLLNMERSPNVRVRLGSRINGKKNHSMKALADSRLLECVSCGNRNLTHDRHTVLCDCGYFAQKKDIVSGQSNRIRVVRASKGFSWALRTKRYDKIIHEKQYRELARARKLRRYALKREENAYISSVKAPLGSVRPWNNFHNLGIMTSQIWYEEKAKPLP